MSDISEHDLFANQAIRKQFDSLPQHEKDAYRQAGEYMYSKDIQSVTENSVDSALDYIRRAFSSGMMPAQLSADELAFLRLACGPQWFTEFGFPSETYPGTDGKKTSSIGKKQMSRPEHDPLMFTKAIIDIKDSQLELLQHPTAHSRLRPETSDLEDTSPSVKTAPVYIDSSTFIDPDEGKDESNRDSAYIYKVWS